MVFYKAREKNTCVSHDILEKEKNTCVSHEILKEEKNTCVSHDILEEEKNTCVSHDILEEEKIGSRYIINKLFVYFAPLRPTKRKKHTHFFFVKNKCIFVYFWTFPSSIVLRHLIPNIKTL